MFSKRFCFIPLFVLLLFTIQVKAGIPQRGKENSKLPVAKQWFNNIDGDTLTAELSASTGVNVPAALKIPVTSPAVMFAGDYYLAAITNQAALTGKPQNTAVKPVALQLLFPFHVFW